jgi:hypothetical protein
VSSRELEIVAKGDKGDRSRSFDEGRGWLAGGDSALGKGGARLLSVARALSCQIFVEAYTPLYTFIVLAPLAAALQT